MTAAALTATPFKWKDPKTLPRRETPWRIEDEFEEYSDAGLAIVKAAIAKWERNNPDAEEPAAPPPSPQPSKPAAANDNTLLPLINPVELVGLPIPIREWLIKGLIPARQVTILNGDGGVGKSLMGLQFTVASAMGVSTCGLEPVQGRCIYIGAEDDEDEFHRRLADIAVALGGSLSDLADLRVVSLADRDALLAVPNKAGNLEPTPLFRSLVAGIGEFAPRFVVLDTAADMFGGDEIKRGQVRQFIGMLRALALQADCAVLLLAHPSLDGMRSGSGSSGSTAWNNSVRSRLYLTKPTGDGADPDARVLKTMKANYGKTGDEIKLMWKDGAFILDDGKPSPANMLLEARAERIFKELLKTINESGQRVSTAKSSTFAPAVMSTMKGADGVPKRELEAAMRRLLEAGEIKIEFEGPPSKQRQRLIMAVSD
ncbi:AAA family ATPase [Hoeflea sp. Naph1]|uniref:AAA family ATPase n=1 Tax=Hoeflea sp. Naph1 TaxID=3388653 RepID=UPI00398FB98B